MNNIWGSGGPLHLSCFFQLKDYILKSISFVKKNIHKTHLSPNVETYALK